MKPLSKCIHLSLMKPYFMIFQNATEITTVLRKNAKKLYQRSKPKIKNHLNEFSKILSLKIKFKTFKSSKNIKNRHIEYFSI